MIGSPDVGMPAASGLGVNTGETPPNGATLFIAGIGARDDRHQVAIGHALHVGGQARDVMRAADDDGAACRTSFAIAAAASSARSVSHGPGQPVAIPGLHGRPRVDDARLARLRHRALLDLAQVRREQREAVRGVAEEVAVDEDRRDVTRDVVAHAGAREQSGRVCNEIGGGMARRAHRELT